jgi:hypothetical protein
MDQLKTQLAVVGKHGFWISSVLVLFASLGIWYMSTSALQQENEQQTSRINGKITSVNSIQGQLSELPNELSHQEMETLISQRRDEVLKSWEKLYDRQKDILVWPQDTFNQEFLNEFVEDGVVKLPIEHYVDFPTENKDELTTTLRRQYANYISNTLPQIAAVVDAEWTADFEQSGGMGMGMEMGAAGSGPGSPRGSGAEVDVTGATTEPLVKWSTTSQAAVLGDLFPWRGQTPTTLEIYYSQENLWILQQLLEIVNELNGDAEQPYQAKVHEIVQIAIGKSVSTTPGNISKPGETGGGDGMGGMGMDSMPDMDMGMGGMDEMGGMGGMGGMSGSAEAADPAENRYWNVSNEPIAAATLRNALESNSPNDASLAVAKRVPVMMKLNMNQTAVHERVALCGSADLMVEVHQVRVLPQNATAGGGMGGGMGGDMEGGDEDMDMGGMGMGMGMGMGGGSGGGMGGPGGGGFPGGAADESEFPLDMSVEIYGIIYIYNPPDQAKLGVEEVTEDTVIDVVEGTMGNQPSDAATPPADGTTPPADGTTPPAMAQRLLPMAQRLLPMAQRLLPMAQRLLPMAQRLLPMAQRLLWRVIVQALVQPPLRLRRSLA